MLATNDCVLSMYHIYVTDPYVYRKKRSTMTELETEVNDHWRVVLLESLGNAALDRSYEYIISHVNTSNSPWIKRAGIHALRSYDKEGVCRYICCKCMYALRSYDKEGARVYRYILISKIN